MARPKNPNFVCKELEEDIARLDQLLEYHFEIQKELQVRLKEKKIELSVLSAGMTR